MSSTAMAFASCSDTYAMPPETAMYSSSKSVEGCVFFCTSTPAAVSSPRRASNSSKVTVCTVSAASSPMRTMDTEPLGSSAAAPFLGSPSSAVRMVLLSAKVTMSGCTPTAAVDSSVSEPSAPHANSATTPAST